MHHERTALPDGERLAAAMTLDTRSYLYLEIGRYPEEVAPMTLDQGKALQHQ